MTPSTFGKCLTKLRLILGKGNKRKAYCLTKNENFITKYIVGNSKDLHVGDFVVLNKDKWEKVELPVINTRINQLGGGVITDALYEIFAIFILLGELCHPKTFFSSFGRLSLMFYYSLQGKTYVPKYTARKRFYS